MTDKKSFLMYHDISEVMLELSDEDAGKLIKEIVFYSIKKSGQNPRKAKKPTGLIGLLDFVSYPFKAHIDRDLEKWKLKATRNKENGKKGGRPKKTETEKPKKPVNVNDNVNDNVNGSEKIKEKLDKQKPENLEQLSQFVTEKNLTPSDADWLWHKWQGNGWTNGNKPIKCWKSTIRSWKAGGFFPSQKALKTSESSEIGRLAL